MRWRSGTRRWRRDRALDILREHDVAIVLADSAGKWPMVDAITSDFAYLRLHGADELYVSGYTDEALDRWADEVDALVADGLDTFVYFDNDAKVRAPYNAMALIDACSTLTGLPSHSDVRRRPGTSGAGSGPRLRRARLRSRPRSRSGSSRCRPSPRS